MRAALMSFGVLAVWVATEQAAVFRDVVFGVLRGRGYTDEQIAGLLGIGRGQLAEQKRLCQHLSAWRLVSIPAHLQRAIFADYLRALGVTVIEDSTLGEFLQEGLMEFRQKRMAKMQLAPATAQKEIA